MKINKKFAIFLAIAAVVIFAVYYWQKPKESAYKTIKVTRGPITQEISETGALKKGEAVNLNFKNAGTVDSLNVSVGDKVSKGQVLARLDTDQLNIQLVQAQANLDLYQAQLDKLINGASANDLVLAQTAANTAQTAYENAQKALADAQINAEQKLTSLYKTASDALNSAYAKAYNAQNFAGLLQRTYFEPRDPDSISVWESTQKIGVAVGQIKDYLDKAFASNSRTDYNLALLAAQNQLTAIDTQLQAIRAICEKTPWRDAVSVTDKNSLDTQRDYIVAALTSVNSAAQNIALQKAANDAAVNAATSSLAAAQGTWQTAQDQLDKISAPPRQEDIDATSAQVAQAKAQVELLRLQISQSELKAPFNGQITEINVRVGETVPLVGGNAAVVIIPDVSYEVEVDIYEEDAAKEKIGNPVAITLVPFPDKVYQGKVISIDPSAKVVNGVAYYTTRIAFDEIPDGAKPGMSADIVITTASNDNALLLPEAAAQKKGTDYIVQILENGKFQDVKVQPGIRSKGMVEIVSGLSEGQEAIIP